MCANVTATSQFEPPYECAMSIGNTCYSANYTFQGENKHNEQHCLCGYSNKGQSYCPLWQGDKLATKYVKLIKDWLTGDDIK